MKHTLYLALAILLSANVIAQTGSIKIFTTIEAAEFKIKFKGELQNTIATQSITFDSLQVKKYHKVRITFNADTIADIEREIYLFGGENRVYEILKKAEARRRTSDTRRKIGKFLKLGGDHSKDEILYEIYYLTRNDDKFEKFKDYKKKKNKQ